MEGEVLAEDELLRKLRDSRCRFQRRMQQLIEKYNQPFEDGPVVQMSTLTYKTPQGLRIWGGGLVERRSTGHMQGSPVKMDGRTDGPRPVPAGDHELPPPDTPADDSKSSDADTTFFQEEVIAGNIMPAVPWSPSKTELRRKYLTQVDMVLQDEGCLECAGYGEEKDTRVTLAPSLASPSRPAHEYCRDISEDSPGGPLQPPPSPREGDASHSCSAGLAVVPRGNSIPLQGTGGSSFSSSPCSEAEDVCNATLSDLYAGMLHSMSRLLGARPSCIISTKTLIGQNWSSRRRHRYPESCRARRESFKEIEIKFDKLYQEYCLSPGKRPSLTYPPSSSAVDVYRGGPASPGSPQGLEAHGLSSPLHRSKAKRLSEAFERLDRRSIREGSCLPKSGSFPSLLKTEPTRSPGRPEQTIDPVFVGSDPGKFQKSVSLSKAISVPRVQPPGFARDRYDDIKEKFDKLHQQYCQKSPQQTQAPSDKAREGVWYQKEGLSGKFNPDSGCRGPPSLSSTPQQSIKSPLASNTVGAPPSTDVALAAGSGHQIPTKRRRSSDPQVCGETPRPWGFSPVGRAVPSPGKEVDSLQLKWEEKKRKE